MIGSQLDKLDPAERVAAIAEVTRRLCARLHTEATKISEGTADQVSGR